MLSASGFSFGNCQGTNSFQTAAGSVIIIKENMQAGVVVFCRLTSQPWQNLQATQSPLHSPQRSATHLALLEVAGDAAHGELQAGLGAARHRLLGRLALAASGHGGCLVESGGSLVTRKHKMARAVASCFENFLAVLRVLSCGSNARPMRAQHSETQRKVFIAF